MKKKILGLVFLGLLITNHLYAADGDLIVNGKLGVGVGPSIPIAKLNVIDSAALTNASIGAAPGSLDFLGLVTPANNFGYGSISTNLYYNGSSWILRDQTHDGWIINQSVDTSNTGTWRLMHANANTNPATTGSLFTVLSTGTIGIGTSTPTYNLHIQASEPALNLESTSPAYGARSTLAFGHSQNGTTTPIAQIYSSLTCGSSCASGDLRIQTANNNALFDRMAISASGNVGIGLTNPTYQLHLSASVNAAAKYDEPSWTNLSDGRLKTNIQAYKKGLDEILQINPVSFKYNGKGGVGHNKISNIDPATGQEVETEVVDSKLLDTTFVGVIAQDIQHVVPETVTSHKGKLDQNDAVETDILDFNASALTYIMINSIKELKAQVDSLSQQIDDLKLKVK